MKRHPSTVLVTGGSRGIGAGIAMLFGARGWNVVLTYVTRESSANAIVAAVRASGGTACCPLRYPTGG
jgi:NAD(P)-dependent dehydrogenase (short-subunit alcohol dehydrogenase family)